VYRLRPFRNSDPPHLAEIWRSQPPQRGLLQPVTPPLLEMGVFSKMAFDRQGLIVAERDGKPIGFVHASFGPDEAGRRLDTSLGTTQVLREPTCCTRARPICAVAARRCSTPAACSR
jgi:hypothetical protein